MDAITGGTDALIDVVIKLKHDGKVVSARSTQPDIINASVEAFLGGINKVLLDKNMKSLIKIPNNQFSEIYSSFLHIFLHNTLFFNKKLELNSGINMNNTTQNHYKFMNHDIQIACFDAEINDLNKVIGFTNSICEKGTVQLLQARGLAGEKHILQAAIQALKAFDNNENTAKDLGLEICLRASAQRQISRALDMLGIKEGKMEVCAVAVDCDKDVLNKLGKFWGNA